MIRKIWKKNWKSKAMQYLFLIFFATGVSVNNTVAIFDALLSGKSEFLRTPKFGIVRRGEDWKNKSYALPFTKTTLLEIFFGLYGCIAIFVSIYSGNSIFVPIIVIQTIGFIYIGYLSIVHSTFKKKPNVKQQELLPQKDTGDTLDHGVTNTVQRRKTDTLNTAAFAKTMVRTAYCGSGVGGNNMTSIYYRLALIGILGFISFGAYMAYYGYQSAVYPVDKAIGYLSRAQTSQTPQMLVNYLKSAKEMLPEGGNPVWSFSTPRTDFELIQNDLDAMISRANSVSLIEPNSAAYNTGLEDIHASIKILQTNVEEAMPYLYVSFTNIFLGITWISVILIVFALMKKGRAKFKEYETA
jgi:hypothetical protein